MEGFLSASPPPACGWGKREARYVAPQGLGCLELCRALLAQVGPGLKAATRDCGVQVNARVDKLVQCSLGPKTLFCPDGDRDGDRDRPAGPRAPRSPDAVTREPQAAQGTPPLGGLRFLRPVSIYSPVFERRIPLRKLCGDGGGSEGEAEPEPEPAEPAQSDQDADPGQRDRDPGKDPRTGAHRPAKGSSFQFLEQRYGFFHCKTCNIRWESAYVWCISGTSKVYYKQLCRKCQVGFNPYRVESILCKGCSLTCCGCEKKQRHINMRRPHRQDLCCRCKGMRLSCDITYSFTYII